MSSSSESRYVFGRLLESALARVLSLLALSLSFCTTAIAQLPTTQLRSLSPPGAQRATTVEVRVQGSDLEGVDRLFFSHPGITAEQVMSKGDDLRSARPVAGRFKVNVSDKVPSGAYEGRVSGRFGVSNPRTFVVGEFTEKSDNGSSNVRESAVLIEPNVTVNGVVKAEQRHFFKLALTAGQRVLVDCSAERIDSRLNASLVLFDDRGRELAHSHDYRGADPFLDVTAPNDGEYFIALFDFAFRGGADYFYRLTFHNTAHIDFVFPPAGMAGSNGTYTLFGRNLTDGTPSEWLVAGTPLEQVDIEVAIPPAAPFPSDHTFVLPAGSMLDTVTSRLGPFATAAVSVTREPIVVEEEPNNEPENAQLVSLPAAVVGQFYPARDVDFVRFEAEKGDVVFLEVVAHRLGNEVDPRMLIERITKTSDGYEKTKIVASVDDSKDRNRKIGQNFDTSTDDPTYRLVVKEAGVYQVRLWDQFGTGSDPRHVYRLSISKPQPDFQLAVVPLPLNTPANANTVRMGSTGIRQGGTASLTVYADRRNGFDQGIEVHATGLPAGVTSRGAFIRPSEMSASLLLDAAEDAQPWAGTIRIEGQATGDQQLKRVARAGTVVWGTTNRQQSPSAFRSSADLGFAVIPELSPAFVTSAEDKVWETSRGGQIEIPLNITRRRDFKGDLQLVCQELPRELKPSNLTVKGDAQEAKLPISVKNSRVKPGLYAFYLRADSTAKLVRDAEAIPAAQSDQAAIVAKVKQAQAEHDGRQQSVAEAKEQLTAAEAAVKQASADAASPDEVKNAQKKLQVAKEGLASAEKGLASAKKKLERAQNAQKAADKQLAAVKKANAPKDTRFVTLSTPIRLRIVDSPLGIDLKQPGPATVGEELRIPISINRMYGFDDKVDVVAQLPKSAAGIKIAKLSLEKGVDQGELVVVASDAAKVGDHKLTIQANATFNKVSVKTSQTVRLQVQATQVAKP